MFYYASGITKAADLRKDPSFSILDDVQIGDQMEGVVVKKDDGAGNIQLSYVEGIRGFIPVSQLSLSYVEDLDTFAGKLWKSA